MNDDTAPRILFSAHRRRLAMARGLLMAKLHGGAFLTEHMADEIVERLGWVNRSFADALVIGHAPAMLLAALDARGVKVTLAGRSAPMSNATKMRCPLHLHRSIW